MIRHVSAVFLFLAAVCLPSLCRAQAELYSILPRFQDNETFYTVQVETLSYPASAESFTAELRHTGYPAYIRTFTTGSGKLLYKIRIGKYKTDAEARAAAEDFRRREQRRVIIVRSQEQAAPSTGEQEDLFTTGDAVFTSMDWSAGKEGTSPDTSEAVPLPDGQPDAAFADQRQSPVRFEPVAPGVHYYTIQVFTEVQQRLAQARLEALRQMGYPGYMLEQKTSAGKVLYKIRMGRYRLKRDAREAGRIYRDRTGRDYLVVKSVLPVPLPEGVKTVRQEPPDGSAQPEGTDEARKEQPAAESPAEPETEKHKPAADRTEEVREHAAADSPVRFERIAEGRPYYTIQTSTERDRDLAESRVSTLLNKGYPAYMTTYTTSGGRVLYKIRMGRYRLKRDARAAAVRFSKSEHHPYLVVQSEKPIAIPPGPRKTGSRLSAAGAEGISAGLEQLKASRIYAYRWPGDELNLTNSISKVPQNLRDKIEYIAVYPVLLAGIDDNGTVVVRIDDTQMRIGLAGVSFPTERSKQLAGGYFEEHIENDHLRLKYDPRMSKQGGLLSGRLYQKGGVFVNEELLRRGIGTFVGETAGPEYAAVLKAAADHARSEHLGIWREGARRPRD